ncbi:hypothetical protein A2U01_0032148, partial [Trifolium medium]|nr:hypothetical protein [Trifolium medium]
ADSPSVAEQLQQRDIVLAQLKANLLKAQQKMKHQADKKRRDWKLEVGELVLVKLQPYRQQYVALRKNNKLSVRYFGPFAVLEKIGEVAYELQLPATAKIHPVFHISQLKPYKGDSQEPYVPLPLSTTEHGPLIQPTAVLDGRIVIQGDQHIPQVLIQWEKGDIPEATWENVKDVQLNYPLFNLEDKIDFIGGGIVVKPTAGQGERNDDSANSVATHSTEVGVRRGCRVRAPNLRLRGYIYIAGSRIRRGIE